MSTLRKGWVTWLLAISALVLIASPQHYRDEIRTANEAARVYSVLAIVDHGSLRLDPVFDAELPGWREQRRLPNVDVAERDGHYYLDKGPGITLAAVPLVALLSAIGVDLGYAQMAWLLAFLFAAVPTILLFLWLGHWFRKNLASDSPALLLPPALIVASPLLIYGGLLFAHALSAALVGVGLTLALGPIGPDAADLTRADRKSAALGGLLLGAAVLVEYVAGFAVAVAAVALLADARRRARLPWLVLGGIGPAVVLATWNTLSFGGPLELSYSYKATPAMAEAHARGLYGIGAPSAGALWGLLGSAQRGLLFLAPWLAVGIVGAVWAAASRSVGVAWRIALPAMVLGVPLLVSGFADWHGGRALGPRYIVAALPLFAIAAGLLVERARAHRSASYLYAVGLGLILSSFLVNLIGAYVFPYVSTKLVNPLFEVNVPVLLEGGPCPTAWERLFPAGLGIGVVLIAGGCVLFALYRCLSARAEAPSFRPRLLAVVICLGTALGHLTAATLPESGSAQRGLVLRERAFTHTYLDQHEAAERVKKSIDPR